MFLIVYKQQYKDQSGWRMLHIMDVSLVYNNHRPYLGSILARSQVAVTINPGLATIHYLLYASISHFAQFGVYIHVPTMKSINQYKIVFSRAHLTQYPNKNIILMSLSHTLQTV